MANYQPNPVLASNPNFTSGYTNPTDNQPQWNQSSYGQQQQSGQFSNYEQPQSAYNSRITLIN